MNPFSIILLLSWGYARSSWKTHNWISYFGPAVNYMPSQTSITVHIVHDLGIRIIDVRVSNSLTAIPRPHDHSDDFESQKLIFIIRIHFRMLPFWMFNTFHQQSNCTNPTTYMLFVHFERKLESHQQQLWDQWDSRCRFRTMVSLLNTMFVWSLFSDDSCSWCKMIPGHYWNVGNLSWLKY